MSGGASAVDVAEARRRLRAADIPAAIVGVVQGLQTRGHQAVLVGGSVRDVLLGLPADDWDVATSATPHEVQAAFRRTIPTGIEHGTVTVLVAAGAETVPVEVTTFRGEGAYEDGRRPASVAFHQDLREDLARRDFTVNAFAWDPVSETLSDPFGGLADLAAGLVRAVGDPTERFAEDGLRTMRAVRFCATRDLALDPATLAAIPGALQVLDKVSRERVHTELMKLLGSATPSRGLVPMIRTGMWPHVLCGMRVEDETECLADVDRLPADPVLRLARLLRPLRPDATPEAVAAFEALKPRKADLRRLSALLGGAAFELGAAASAWEMRRAASRLGREHVADVGAVFGWSDPRRTAVKVALEGAALGRAELALAGRDLIARGVVPAGPEVGKLLDRLLAEVLRDPTLNTPQALMALASPGSNGPT